MKDEGQITKPEPKPSKKKATLGPLRSLEQHVPVDWWNRIFNATYLKTDADVVDDEQLTRDDVDLVLNNLDLRPESRILDLCCGQGRHVLELARRGFVSAEGFDRSHYLITKARQRSRKLGLGVKFREGDARKLPYAVDSFDTVLIMGNSFGYFETANDDLTVLKGIAHVLKPGGNIFLDLADGEYLRQHFQSRSWEWINSNLFVCRERELSDDGQRLISREVVTDVNKGVITDQFYAERLYSAEGIQHLLSEAGFDSIEFCGQLDTATARNQDLGMMAKRIIIKASVKKDWTAPKARTSKENQLVVLFGDPQRPDIIKPSSVFDEDDIATIEKLKSALANHKALKVRYLNNHNSLIHDLRLVAGEQNTVVFNLCDEGLFNDAYKELHVPALLEAMQIPYTGSGPRCLAYCYDKSLVRGLAQEMGVPVARAFFAQPENTTIDLPFDFPAIVKPNFGDSSFGITAKSVVNSAIELMDAVNRIRSEFGHDRPLLVEQFLTGADLSVGIIGTPPSSYHVLPIVEEDYGALPDHLPQICGYEAKWNPDSPYWHLKSVRAQLSDEQRESIVEWCVLLAERLECRDYTRFDWRLDAKGRPHLLEVNPNPGWCWDGHLAKMAALDGIDYSGLLKMILNAGFDRLGRAQF